MKLASTVAVFEFNETLARASVDNPKGNLQTLSHVQTISTIPKGYPKNLNTCGRIAVSPSGNWVLGSNRGHDSIAVFSVQRDTYNCQSGHLVLAGYFQIYDISTFSIYNRKFLVISCVQFVKFQTGTIYA